MEDKKVKVILYFPMLIGNNNIGMNTARKNSI